MGGSAFSRGPSPLYTPRMPPAIYHAQKARCQALLRQFYVHVDSPIDGPGKKDFGDIDIFVLERRPDAGPAPKPARELINELGTILGSKSTLIDENSSSHFAIPWPADADDQVTPHGVDNASASLSSPRSTPDEKEKFIQVDVRISSSLEVHNWMLFKHAHGDIWSIIGSLVQPYGLTIDDAGMHVRIPEIETKSKKLCKVHLTSNPNLVLDFLGLPQTGAEYRYIWTDQPFPTPDAMFEYVALCWMMYIKPQDDSGIFNSRGRQRFKKRPVFKAWYEGFREQCRTKGRFTVEPTSRLEVTKKALEKFDVGQVFNDRLCQFQQEVQRSHIREIINGIEPLLMPDCPPEVAITTRSCLQKDLKKIILDGDKSYGVQFDESMRDARGFYNEHEVRRFIEQHKEAVQAAAIEKHNAQFIFWKKKKANKQKKINEQMQPKSEGQEVGADAGKQEQDTEEQNSED